MSQSHDQPFPSGPGAYPTAYPPTYSAPPAVTPGVVPLRPLQVGELLDGAATALRAHPGIMLGLSAIVVAAGQLLAIPLDYVYLRYLAGLVDGSTTTGDGLGINEMAALRPGALINILTMSLLVGLLITTVSRAVLGRRTGTVRTKRRGTEC